MIIDVPQREFAFGQRGTCVEGLETGDVRTCSAIVAIDRENGLIFMAHLDVCWLSSASVEKAFRELRERASATTNVELYDVAGFTPAMLILSVLVVGAVMSAAFGVWGGLMLASIWAFFFGGTRWRVRRTLRHLGFARPRLLTGREARGSLRRRLRCKVNVRLRTLAGVAAAPELYFPEGAERDPRFEVRSMAEKVGAVGRWHLTRADGSV